MALGRSQEVLQVVGQVLRRRVPFQSSFRQSFQANSIQFLWNVVCNLSRRPWLDGRDLLQKFFRRFALEGMLAREQFVKYDTEAKNIAAAIDPMPFATSLLGRHISRRPSDAGVP